MSLLKCLILVLVTNTKTKITNKANSKLKSVCMLLLFIVSSKIFSKAINELIKTIMGNNRATMTLGTIEGPLLLPSFW